MTKTEKYSELMNKIDRLIDKMDSATEKANKLLESRES